MPAQDQSRGRQKRSHQKQIDAGIIAQPAAQQRPHHAAATRRVRRAARHGSIPRTLRAALSVPDAGAVRTTARARTPPGASRLVPHTLGAALPILAARRLAVEERTNRRANAATRSRSISLAPRQKKSAAPHTRQRPPPLAVQCAELPPLPQRSTGRRNPIPQHPQQRRKSDRSQARSQPPDQSRKCSRWGNLAFADPRHPGARPTCARRTTGPAYHGESQANLSRAAPLQDGRQTAAARRKRFKRFSPTRIQAAARPACVRRTSCHRNQGEKRMNPVMKVPCQNRPHLLPTGRWSGGRMRRGGGAIASTMRGKARARGAASRPRDSPYTYMCVNICQ